LKSAYTWIINTPKHKLPHPPGDYAIWIFILVELTAFAIFFVLYAFARAYNPELFAEGFSHLNRVAGTINTVALITSSFFVVCAVAAIQRNRQGSCVAWLLAALFAGCIYVGVKLWEYSGSLAAGYDLSTNTFYTLYYLLTFFHFCHVLIGMMILAVLAFNAARGKYSSEDYHGVETGASYWHMVDLAWVILFPLVYVIH